MFLWIQVLRGIAALLVVAVHYSEAEASRGINHFQWISKIGGIGVDIFFIISGFIMMHSHGNDNKKYSPLSFLFKRLIRIAPLYWVLTLLAFLLASALPSINSKFNIYTFFASMLFFPYSETPLAMGAEAFKAYVLPMAWTLTYEWYFYIIFAAVISINITTKKRFIALAFLFLASTILGILLKPTSIILQIITSPLTIEFIFGCLIAILYKSNVRASRFQLIVFISIGLFIILFFNPRNTLERTLIWGSAAFLLVCSATLFDQKKIKRPWNFLVRLGDISYSIYLCHFFTIALFVRLQTKIKFLDSGTSIQSISVFMVLTTFIATICFKFIENPSKEFLPKKM